MRLIDADKAIEVADDLYEKYNFAMACADTQKEINHIFKRQELFKAVRAVIEHCPTINPVKHGKWLGMKQCNMDAETTYCANCSVCGVEVVLWEHDSYCPCCGVRMDGDNE